MDSRRISLTKSSKNLGKSEPLNVMVNFVLKGLKSDFHLKFSSGLVWRCWTLHYLFMAEWSEMEMFKWKHLTRQALSVLNQLHSNSLHSSHPLGPQRISWGIRRHSIWQSSGISEGVPFYNCLGSQIVFWLTIFCGTRGFPFDHLWGFKMVFHLTI